MAHTYIIHVYALYGNYHDGTSDYRLVENSFKLFIGKLKVTQA